MNQIKPGILVEQKIRDGIITGNTAGCASHTHEERIPDTRRSFCAGGTSRAILSVSAGGALCAGGALWARRTLCSDGSVYPI